MSKKPSPAVNKLRARFTVSVKLCMPKTVFADAIRQTPTHLHLKVGTQTVKVPMENVLSVRQRDTTSFRSMNPALVTGSTKEYFYDVLYHHTTITGSFSAHAVADGPDETGLIPVTATDGSITHVHPAAIHVVPYAI